MSVKNFNEFLALTGLTTYTASRCLQLMGIEVSRQTLDFYKDGTTGSPRLDIVEGLDLLGTFCGQPKGSFKELIAEEFKPQNVNKARILELIESARKREEKAKEAKKGKKK